MKKDIESIIEDNSMEYSAYILTNRVIPDLRDSCKPVVRRIIYTMHKEKAYKFTKSATMSGKVMAIHPHGDCFPTMVGMVQKDTQIIPWLEGKGNFSQHTSRDLMYASSRYSEVKLSQYTIDVLKGLNDKSVKYVSNYDGTIMIPEALPVKFPMILHYCQMGIGYGMSSNIPSFNKIETNNAIENYVKTGITTDLIPDFATGGLIVNNKANISKINNTGIGSVTLRGTCSIDGNTIIITEIPYSTTREAIIDKVIELVKDGRLKEVVKINDSTGLKGMCIKIECKKNTDTSLLIQKLYSMTPLESTFSANMNVLHNGLPKVMGTWEIIKEWLEWRKECIKSTYEEDIKNTKSKLHLYEGLIKILDFIDDVIVIIRASETDEKMIEELMIKFGITKLQAEYISDIKIRNLNKSHINKTTKDKTDLELQIENLSKILNSDKLILDIILSEMKDVSNKYGKPRLTKIIDEVNMSKEVKITKQDLVESYSTQIILTKESYVKKTRKYSETQKMKDGDSISQVQQCDNKGNIIILTSIGNAHVIPINSLIDKQPSSIGEYLPSILKLEESEKIVGMIATSDYTGHIITVFSNGKIAKVPLKSFATKTARKCLSNSLTILNGEVVGLYQIQEDIDIGLTDSFGKIKLINTKDVNEKTSRNTVGVTMMKSVRDGFKITNSKISN